MNTKYLLPSLVIVFAMAFGNTTTAQTNREIGVRILANGGSDVIFKKEKNPNRFNRFRAGISNLGYLVNNGSDAFVFGAGIGFGKERRKNIEENLHFITGWEIQAGVLSFDSNSNGQVGLGFILGFQYDVGDNLAVVAETIPNISTNFGDGFDSSFNINAGINGTAAIGLIYRFQK